MTYPSVVLSLITGPVRTEIKNGREVLTHLQKYSYFGFMLTISLWNFIPIPCFHFWLFWKKQEGSDLDGWRPGTERGIYFRTPGRRWDYDLGMKPTWGFFGGHWD